MKKKFIFIILSFITCLLLVSFSYNSYLKFSKNSNLIISKCTINSKDKSSNGGIKYRTQSAVDESLFPTKNHCLECHGNTGSVIPEITIKFTPELINGKNFIPGKEYLISYFVKGYTYFGFDLEINDGNSITSQTAGSFSGIRNSQYDWLNNFPVNVTHTDIIQESDSATFTWNAPINETPVYLFSTAMGVENSDGSHIAFKNLILNPIINSSGLQSISDFTLFKLYPNPVKDIAFVNYYLIKDSHITITISDLNSKVISTPVNEDAVAGSYSKELVFNNLNSGTYFVKIKSNDQTFTKKLVIQ